eukprot:8444934-Heterocapsa_arctica.AAC.1
MKRMMDPPTPPGLSHIQQSGAGPGAPPGLEPQELGIPLAQEAVVPGRRATTFHGGRHASGK